MAVTHAAATRTNLATQVKTDIEAGAGNATLEFQTSGGVEVATLTCADPVGTVSGPTLTFDTITSDTSATGGTIAKAQIKTGTGTAIVSCACGTSGSDINLSSLVIGVGDTVSCSSLTYTAPA